MMMGLTLSLDLRQEQKMEVTCEMAACNNIFPAVEAWLQTNSDHQNALKYIGSHKKMGRYMCMVDFLISEFFGGEIKKSCFRYYEEKGPKLKELITDEVRERMEAILLFALSSAYKIYCDKRRMKWSEFVFETYLRFAA
jgi:hypothetical protein